MDSSNFQADVQIDPRASRSRKALMEAGINTLLLNSDASMSEIAERAGVGRATLYRHFSTREQLILAIALESLEETDKACAHIHEQKLNGRAAIEEVFYSIMPLADRFHFLLSLWNVVDNNKQLKQIYDRQLAQLENRIKEAKQEKTIKKSIPNDWLVVVIDNLIYSGWLCVNQNQMTPKQVAKLSINTFFDGVRPG